MTRMQSFADPILCALRFLDPASRSMSPELSYFARLFSSDRTVKASSEKKHKKLQSCCLASASKPRRRRLGDLLELELGIGVVRILVRVKPPRKSSQRDHAEARGDRESARERERGRD